MTAEPIRIPVEITSAPPVFDMVSRGYDRTQVDEHLLAVEQELAEACWQRDWLTSREQEVRHETERLAAERAGWEAERDAWQVERDAWEPSPTKIGDRAHQILRMAHEEAAELLETTRRDCAELLAAAEAEAAAAREAFEREAAEARAALRKDLDLQRLTAQAEANEVSHRARQQAERITEKARHDSETLRLRATEDLAAARQERAKAARLLGDLADRMRRDADRLDTSHTDTTDEDKSRPLLVLTNHLA